MALLIWLEMNSGLRVVAESAVVGGSVKFRCTITVWGATDPDVPVFGFCATTGVEREPPPPEQAASSDETTTRVAKRKTRIVRKTLSKKERESRVVHLKTSKPS